MTVKTGQRFLWEATLMKYFQRRKKRKLYRQWVQRASLPRDAIPREEVAKDRIPRIPRILQVDKPQSRPTILYILLGVAVVGLCAGLILLIVYSS